MTVYRTLKRHFYMIWFTINSLQYNTSRSRNHYIDSAFEPLFWFVDNFTAYLGAIFVVAVILATSSVVVVWYMFLFPIIRTYSQFWFWAHYLVAHYLLVNIVFHYYKAVSTSAGKPPHGLDIGNIKRAVVCKKCVQPKPPRTHHCSVCSQCFLKMDHHCPWMNNCIGFYNHRYFVCFCIFMWLGTIYVCLTSYSTFTFHVLHPENLASKPFSFSMSFGLQPFLEQLTKSNESRSFLDMQIKKMLKDYGPHPGGFTEIHHYEHVAIIYLFILCAAVTAALTFLNVWHVTLVCRGETSIEVHVNSSEKKRAAMQGMGYNNPYNYGWKENWNKMLGLQNGRSWMSVLMPSTHLPEGDGMLWPSNNKPINFSDPTAFEKYEKTKNSICRWCYC